MLYRGKDKFRLRRSIDSAMEYNEIMDREGPLKRSNNIQSKDIFLLALAFGYMEDVSIPIVDDDKFLKASTFEDVLPVLINALCLDKDGGVQLALEMHAAQDSLGLLKLDVLGLRQISIIDDCLRYAGLTWQDVDINHLNLDDKEVYEENCFDEIKANRFVCSAIVLIVSEI